MTVKSERRFNLVDESWIPVVGKGKLSLMEVFNFDGESALGGTPTEKMVVYNILCKP